MVNCNPWIPVKVLVHLCHMIAGLVVHYEDSAGVSFELENQ